jgi:hypothetical protein
MKFLRTFLCAFPVLLAVLGNFGGQDHGIPLKL